MKGTALIIAVKCPLHTNEAVFRFFKIPKILQDSLSHQIFGRMHGALNVGKKNN
jgi:hypothetical protein